MILSLFTTPLLAAILLLSTLSCAKKQDDPTPAPVPASGTGSYMVDGRSVNCKATFYKGSTNTGLDVLIVYLITTPQPATGPEKFTLSYTKKPSEPVSAYETSGADLSLTNPNRGTVYDIDSYTTAATSSGGVSGTFAGATNPYNPGKSVVTDGVFTDVHQ